MRRYLAAFFGGVASMYLNLLVFLLFFLFCEMVKSQFLILHSIDESGKTFKVKKKNRAFLFPVCETEMQSPICFFSSFFLFLSQIATIFICKFQWPFVLF